MNKQQLRPAAYNLKLNEDKKIIHATNSFRDRCLIKALFWAGLRREEATDLDIRDIDFERKRITVRGKGDKTRIVPIIDDDLLNDLKHLIGKNNQGYVFCQSNGKPVVKRTINKIVEKAGERAGITNPNPARQHINPHIFRHSIARYLKNKGFSAEWIQNFLGHASYKTTMDMYGTLSIDEMQQEAESRLQE
jgi:site-specific recombinase XerD